MKTIFQMLVLSFMLILFFTGEASAIPFRNLDPGLNITINDTIWNSDYNPYRNSRTPNGQLLPTAANIGLEDNETEKLNNGTNTYTGQRWDFEGMFWNGNTGILTLIAGWDFANGVKIGNEIVNIGDFFMGSWGAQDYAHSKKFVANEALDFTRDGDGSLQASGAYKKITGNFQTSASSDVTPLSDPYLYKSGGSTAISNTFTYTTGLATETPFSGWYDSDQGNKWNDTHYYMQIRGLSPGEIKGDILHVTLGCGNDTGRGVAPPTPVPEPSTVALWGMGIAVVAFGRRQLKK